MKSQANRLTSWLFLLSVIGSAGLVMMGVAFCLDPVDAARLFGVPLSGTADGTYVSVAAVRDISVGVLTLAFAVLRDRRAVGLCVLLGAIIPIGDGIIVLRNSATPLHFLPLHWGGAVACVAFAWLLLRPSSD